jgi:hypothetical protein
MDAREFVACWRREKESLLTAFTDKNSTTHVAQGIRQLGLRDDQGKALVAVLDAVLTDTLYTLLLGLDGEAAIGGVQQTYRVYDEGGSLISDRGDIEAEAYRQFHGEVA